MIMGENTTTTKPVVKVRVGGLPYRRGEICYVYLVCQPRVFKKVGTSQNPHVLAMSMLPFPGLTLLEARVFHTRGEAVAFEATLRKKFARHRIPAPAFGNPRSTKYFDPGADIHL